MSRRWFALVVFILILVSVNGCCHCRQRQGLLARIRGQSATPYAEQSDPGAFPSYPTNMSGAGAEGGACCNGNGAGPMLIPGGGFGAPV